MLVELAVRDLGVIADLRLVLGPGMTALTGETGAGKTLVVEAIELLVGGRADPVLVRPGRRRGLGRGPLRSLTTASEVVLARVVPADGRSRGLRRRPAGHGRPRWPSRARGSSTCTASTPTSRCWRRPPARRLDRFAGDRPRAAARRRAPACGRVDAALAALGGDERARAREIDLLRFQVDELDAAAIDRRRRGRAPRGRGGRAGRRGGPPEAAAAAARGARRRRRRGRQRRRRRSAALAGRAPFAGSRNACAALAAELADVAAELRARRRGDRGGPRAARGVRVAASCCATCAASTATRSADVMALREEARRAPRRARAARRAGAAALDAERRARRRRGGGRRGGRRARRAARRRARRWPRPSQAPPAGRWPWPARAFEVQVGAEDPGDDVAFLLAANPGEPPLPLAKVASGGELARTMLALRLVLTDGAADTLVFDEVDAGDRRRGRRSPSGRALAALARQHQVLVVTHLPQVAAFADAQVAVTKEERRRPHGRAGVAAARRRRAGGRAVADAVGPARERTRREPRRGAARRGRGERAGRRLMAGASRARWPGEPATRSRGRLRASDRRTKNLVQRLQPGEIAVIDHEDLDRVGGRGRSSARGSAPWSTRRASISGATRTSARCCSRPPASR